MPAGIGDRAGTHRIVLVFLDIHRRCGDKDRWPVSTAAGAVTSALVWTLGSTATRVDAVAIARIAVQLQLLQIEIDRRLAAIENEVGSIHSMRR